MKTITHDFTVREWRIISLALAGLKMTTLNGDIEENRRNIHAMIDKILNETKKYDRNGELKND